MNKFNAITPLAMLKQAFNDAPNAIEFCNWYMMNRPTLETHELQLLDIAYLDGVEDQKQDPDRSYRPGDYIQDRFKKDDN